MTNPENSNEYLTKIEFCKLCGISASTTYKLLKKKIKFEECREGKLHYYKIPVSEVVKYKLEQEQCVTVSSEQEKVLHEYYYNKLKPYPELVTAYDIRCITGYAKETIRIWINSKKILGTVVRHKFCVAKADLIDFLVSPYYKNIARKSKTHISDQNFLSMFEEKIGRL